MAKNEAGIEAALSVLAPSYLAKLTCFLAFEHLNLLPRWLEKMLKTVLLILAILCARREFSPLSLPPGWKAILRHDIWQKSAINPDNSHVTWALLSSARPCGGDCDAILRGVAEML